MEKAKKLILTLLGALGWGILGVLIMRLQLGPWWVGWVPFVIALCVIAAAVDNALSPGGGW